MLHHNYMPVVLKFIFVMLFKYIMVQTTHLANIGQPGAYPHQERYVEAIITDVAFTHTYSIVTAHSSFGQITENIGQIAAYKTNLRYDIS